MPDSKLQLDSQGRLRHLLTIEGLSPEILQSILDRATTFINANQQIIYDLPLLQGNTVANVFFEASTRTRSSFELAANYLAAKVLNVDVTRSSITKGETLLDTIYNLQAMLINIFVVRHHESGTAHFLAANLPPHTAIINAGDGQHAHPTQALLDMFTIRYHKQQFAPLIVTLIGDIAHSRVARSDIHALQTLGVAEIRVVAPKTLLPTHVDVFGVRLFHQLEPALRDADVIMTLRLQHERMQTAAIPSENEFHALYGLTEERLKLAKPDALLMHPGPINRGVELTSATADGTHSTILQQVTFGIAIRMAVLATLTETRKEST